MEAEEGRRHARVGCDGPLDARADDLLGAGAGRPVHAGTEGHAGAGTSPCPAVADAHGGAGAAGDARRVGVGGGPGGGGSGCCEHEQQADDLQGHRGGGVRHGRMMQGELSLLVIVVFVVGRGDRVRC